MIEFGQSALERFAYIILLLVFIANIVMFASFVHQESQIKQLLNIHSQTLSRQQIETEQIKSNQYNNSSALEDFIREGLVCLFTQSPTTNQTQITTEVNNCFKNTPEVK